MSKQSAALSAATQSGKRSISTLDSLCGIQREGDLFYLFFLHEPLYRIKLFRMQTLSRSKKPPLYFFLSKVDMKKMISSQDTITIIIYRY